MSEIKSKSSGKLATAISIVLCVLLVPIIIINTVMIVQSYTRPGHLPSVFGISPVVVLSGSMSPVFKTDSLIFVKDVETDTLQKGDVICFMQDGTAITHRIDDIVEKDGQKNFVTKGDANNTADKLAVSTAQIEGQYIGHIEGAGGAVMFMQSTTGMILFIVLPVLIYLGFDMMIRRKENKSDREHAEELEAELAELKSKK